MSQEEERVLQRMERIAGLVKWFVGGVAAMIAAVFSLGAMVQAQTNEREHLRARMSVVESRQQAHGDELNQVKEKLSGELSAIREAVEWIKRDLQQRR